MKERKPKHVVIYARFSPRPNAAECDSIEKQEQRLRAWAVAKDLPVDGSYSDADQTGGSTDGREGLQQALQHARCIFNFYVVYLDVLPCGDMHNSAAEATAKFRYPVELSR